MKYFAKLLTQKTEKLIGEQEIKNYLHAASLDDAEIEILYNSAVNYLEQYLVRNIVYKEWKLKAYNNYHDTIKLPHYPINQIIKVKASFNNECNVILSPNSYMLQNEDTLLLKDNRAIFAEELTIYYSTGYDILTLPQTLRHAILEFMLISYNREPNLSNTLYALLAPFKLTKI